MALNSQGLHTLMFWLVPAYLALSDKLTNLWLSIATCEIHWPWRRTPKDSPLNHTSCILSAGYRFRLKSVLQVCGRWASGYMSLFLKRILTWDFLRNNRFFSRYVPIVTARNYGWLNQQPQGIRLSKPMHLSLSTYIPMNPETCHSKVLSSATIILVTRYATFVIYSRVGHRL